MAPLTLDVDPAALAALLATVQPPPRLVAPPLSRHLCKRFYDLLPDRECPICLDQIRAFSHFELRACGHYFHKECWSRADRTACAVCNH